MCMTTKLKKTREILKEFPANSLDLLLTPARGGSPEVNILILIVCRGYSLFSHLFSSLCILVHCNNLLSKQRLTFGFSSQLFSSSQTILRFRREKDWGIKSVDFLFSYFSFCYSFILTPFSSSVIEVNQKEKKRTKLEMRMEESLRERNGWQNGCASCSSSHTKCVQGQTDRRKELKGNGT